MTNLTLELATLRLLGSWVLIDWSFVCFCLVLKETSQNDAHQKGPAKITLISYRCRLGFKLFNKNFFFFYSFFYLLFCFFLPFDFSTNDCSNSSTRPFIFFNFTSLLEGFGPQPT